MRDGLRAQWRELGRGVIACDLHRPAKLIGVLVLLMAARTLYQDISYAFTGTPASMFFDPTDRYADFIKISLSFCDLSRICGTAPGGNWATVFAHYLHHSVYDNSDANLFADIRASRISGLHSPPLDMLLYLICLRLIWAVGPTVALGVFAASYLALVIGVTWFAARSFGTRRVGWLVAMLCVASYPALWMLSRANLPGGYSAVFTLLWLVTAWTGRARWAGWIALAIAVNFRAEPALLVLLELVDRDALPKRFLRMVIPGVLTLAIAAAAFAVDHALYPHYTVERIARGLAIYNHHFVVLAKGEEWNSSIYMMIGARAAQALAIGLIGLTVRAALLGRIDRSPLIFVATAIPALLVPVYGYYHMLAFAAVLVALVVDFAERPPQAIDARFALLVITALLMSPLGGSFSNGSTDAELLTLGLAICLVPTLRRTREPAPVAAFA